MMTQQMTQLNASKDESKVAKKNATVKVDYSKMPEIFY